MEPSYPLGDHMNRYPLFTAVVFTITAISLLITKASWPGVSQLGLVVSEIMYHPLPPSDNETAAGFTDDQFDYLELTNTTTEPIDLAGLQLSGAVNGTLSPDHALVLPANESAVIAAHAEAFRQRYGTTARLLGVFTGDLPNDGGHLRLDFNAAPPLTFSYGVTPPWPATPRGQGFALVLAHPAEQPNHAQPSAWRASAKPGGSPGLTDSEPTTPTVRINEVLPRATVLDTYFRIASYPTSPSQAPTAFIQQFVADMRAAPYTFSFIHLVAPDLVGHAYGWYSERQDNAIRAVDVDLGEVLRLIDEDPRLTGKTAVILTADHAGGGEAPNNHLDSSYPINFTIPFHVRGPGIPPASDLYALNASTRTRPQPEENPIISLDTASMPIRNGELGNLALSLLGLPPIPGSWINHDQSLVTGAENQVDYVIAISVDGLGPQSIQRLGPENLPNLFRLRAEGAFTDDARTDDTHTYTNPNHTGMLTGRGTLDHANVGRGHHVTFNSDVDTTLRDWNSGTYIASVFDVVKGFGLTCSFFSNKTKLDFLGRSYAAIDGDKVELHNPTDTPADISTWGLSDDPSDPFKWRLPQGSVIPAGGYLVLNKDPGWRSSARPGKLVDYFGSAFSLPAHDGELYLFASENNTLSGYSQGFLIDNVPPNYSVLLQDTANGDAYPLAARPTLNGANTVPLSSPLVITEWALQPNQSTIRFIEIQNLSQQTVYLAQWALRGAYTLDFPVDSTLAPGQIAVLATAPHTFADLATTAIFGPMLPANASSKGHIDLVLRTTDDYGSLSEIPFDSISLDGVWPSAALQGGHAMERRDPRSLANDTSNWALADDADGSPGRLVKRRYADWAALHFPQMEASLAATDADPDDDRRSNLIEYAFGSDPLNDESWADPEYHWGPGRAGLLGITFQRPIDVTDIVYALETSTNLTTWTTASNVALELGERQALGQHLEAITYLITPPQGTRFVRMRIEPSAPESF